MNHTPPSMTTDSPSPIRSPYLILLIGLCAFIAALSHYFDSGIVLLGVGALTILCGIYLFWRDPSRGEQIRRVINEISPARCLMLIGTLLLAIGVITRFSPADLGLLIASAGLLILSGGAFYAFTIPHFRPNSVPKDKLTRPAIYRSSKQSA